MRYYIVALFFLFITEEIKSQDYRFSVGPIYSRFIYESYNMSDWNNRPDSYPYRNKSLNGKAIGLRTQIPFSDSYLLSFGVIYSNQQQEHRVLSYTDISPVDTTEKQYYYGNDVKTNFDIISAPIYFNFSKELGYNSGLFITIGMGPQISYIVNYKTKFTQYAFDNSELKILYDSLVNEIIISNEKSDQIILMGNPPQYVENHSTIGRIYKRILFGLSGEINLQKSIGNNYIFGIGFLTDYDITDSEIKPFYSFPFLGGHINGDRSKSHNIRYGLNFTIQYKFL